MLTPTPTPPTARAVSEVLEAAREIANRLTNARNGELTGVRCEHGWDTSVCPIRGCGEDEDELFEQLLATLAHETEAGS